MDDRPEWVRRFLSTDAARLNPERAQRILHDFVAGGVDGRAGEGLGIPRSPGDTRAASRVSGGQAPATPNG